MKKVNLFYALLTVFSVAMVFSSCGPKKTKSADSQEAVAKSRGVEPGTTAPPPSDDEQPDRTQQQDDAPTGDTGTSGPEHTAPFVCTDHCKGSGSKVAGKCPVCGKAYVANETHSPHGERDNGDDAEGAGEREIDQSDDAGASGR